MTVTKLFLRVKELPKGAVDPEEEVAEAVYDLKRGSGVTFGAVAQFVKKHFDVGKAPVSTIKFSDVEGIKIDLMTSVEVYADTWKNEDDEAEVYFYIHQHPRPSVPKAVPASTSKTTGTKRAAPAEEVTSRRVSARYGEQEPPAGAEGGSGGKRKTSPSVPQLSSKLQGAIGKAAEGQQSMSTSSATAQSRSKGLASQASRGAADVRFQPVDTEVFSVESGEGVEGAASTCFVCGKDVKDTLALQCIVCQRFSKCGSLRGGYELGLFVCCDDRPAVDQVRASNHTLLRIQGMQLQFGDLGEGEGDGGSGGGGKCGSSRGCAPATGQTGTSNSDEPVNETTE